MTKTHVTIPESAWQEWESITDPWDYVRAVWGHILGKPLAEYEGSIDPTAYTLSKADW